MIDPYISWLSDFSDNNSPGAVSDEDAVNQMVAAFPTELQAVQGFVYTTQGKLPYWWAVDSSGQIYSPTVHQFVVPPYLYEAL